MSVKCSSYLPCIAMAHSPKCVYLAQIGPNSLHGIIILKVMGWLENNPNTSDDNNEEDIGDMEEKVSDEEKDVSDGEDTEADKEQVAKVEGKLFLTSLFEVVYHAKISYKGHF